MGYSTAPAGHKPILVALDLSERSEPCLAQGCELATKFERSLVVVHIVHETAENAGLYRRHQAKLDTTPAQDIARSMVEERVAAFLASGDGPRAECEIQLAVVDGIPETRIPELATHYDAGMIVMCSANRGGLSRWLRGSVTESVIKRAACPVVVVGQENGGLSARAINRHGAQRTAALHGA